MPWIDLAKEALPLFKRPSFLFTILILAAMFYGSLYLFHRTTVSIIGESQLKSGEMVAKSLDRQTDAFERLREAILKREIAKGD